MRRFSSLGLILATLALFARLVVPAAVEARTVDLFSTAICSHDAQGAPSTDRPSDRPTHDHALCDLTCCHIAPLAILPPVSGVVTQCRIEGAIAWTRDFDLPHNTAERGSYRARGPPRVS